MTWWMMAGDIFRFADNTNMPLANTMVFYFMNKYHGASIARWGDEQTLHYHTFAWTDYNRDGIYYWNQAKTFAECREDFDITLAQILLEEHRFPVSFRSGWHAMDNGWQAYLDTLLPYSLHDDYPAVRSDTTEPIDNVYDWSKSSSKFVPFHPSLQNYQLPGNCKGWNVRSIYMSQCDSVFMETVFSEAAKGIDQVVCMWAHLPETDFLDNITKVNTSAHKVAPRYPGIPFRYCTAVEAMQKWRGGSDTTAPLLTLTEFTDGERIGWNIASDEPIFQPAPFVALEDRNEQYFVLPCTRVNTTTWKTSQTFVKNSIAAVGAALTDTMGNQSMRFIRYLPENIFIDNLENGYHEQYGSWSTSASASWGTDSRTAFLRNTDSAKVMWDSRVTQSGLYNIFIQVPSLTAPARNILFRICQGAKMDSVRFTSPLPPGKWVYIATTQISDPAQHRLEMIGFGNGKDTTILSADVIKYSALVRDRCLIPETQRIDFDQVSELDTAWTTLSVRNEGILAVMLSSISERTGRIIARTVLPAIVPAMKSSVIEIGLIARTRGTITDSIRILSNDPVHEITSIPFTAQVVSYFRLVDNADSTHYQEFGTWSTSTSSGYSGSSRYTYITGKGSAKFFFKLAKAGTYDLKEIVPATANSSTKACYRLSVNSVPVDSADIDQNLNSGGWVTVLRHSLPAEIPVDVTVFDAGGGTAATPVLRADAVMLQIVPESSGVKDNGQTNIPAQFVLEQNYPNPCNPTTTITFSVGTYCHTSLRVFDLLGREIAILVNEQKPAGSYQVQWNAGGIPSGIYFYRLQSGAFTETKKLILLK